MFQSTTAKKVQIVPFNKKLEPNIYPAYASSLSKRFYLPEKLKIQIVEEKVRKIEALNKKAFQEYQEMLDNQFANEFQEYQYMQKQQLMMLSNQSYYSRQKEIRYELIKARSKLHQNDYNDSSENSTYEYDDTHKNPDENYKKKRRNKSMRNLIGQPKKTKNKKRNNELYLPHIQTNPQIVKGNEMNNLENNDKDRLNVNADMGNVRSDLKTLKDEMELQLKSLEEQRYSINYSNNNLNDKPYYLRVIDAIQKYEEWEREIYEDLERNQNYVVNNDNEHQKNERQEEEEIKEQSKDNNEIKEDDNKGQINTSQNKVGQRRKKKALSDGPKINISVFKDKDKTKSILIK